MTIYFNVFTQFIEKFSTKAETKILRSVFALDSLMCQVENDLENLNPAKKLREETTSCESELENDSENSESSSESD